MFFVGFLSVFAGFVRFCCLSNFILTNSCPFIDFVRSFGRMPFMATGQLQTSLLIHLANGIAAGVQAIHTLTVAHRDIKSSHVLLKFSREGWPLPVISDFTTARTAYVPFFFNIQCLMVCDSDDEIATLAMGSSLRYASPQVFAHIHDPTASWSLEEDFASDVFSVAVIFWELLTRRVPWENSTEVEIERSMFAERFLMVPQYTEIERFSLGELVKTIFTLDYTVRPTIDHVVEVLSRLAGNETTQPAFTTRSQLK